MGEFELIRRYFASAACAAGQPGVVLGIGDDCALLQLAADEQLAISTDTLVAGVHFPQPCSAELLGQRARAVAASDLAGMGASPLGFTLALTLPQADAPWLQGFADGLQQMAAACGLSLIGGDTTRGPLSLTVTVFGRLPAGQALTRGAAQEGDLLCVGGELGAACAALELLLHGREAPAAQRDALLQAFWSPMPQLSLGEYLRGRASAALDISDGLLADCGHIAQASGVALQIEQAAVPLSAAAEALLGHTAAQRCALSGGDDYRLAFTLPAEHWPALSVAFPTVRRIGRVVAGTGVQLLDEQGCPLPLPGSGYQHFGAVHG